MQARDMLSSAVFFRNYMKSGLQLFQQHQREVVGE